MLAHLISCANATCAVPEAYRELFRGAESDVQSAEGWEPGALNLAQAFSMKFRTPLVHGEVTRLLIDLEAGDNERWSRFSEKIPETSRQRLAERMDRTFRLLLDQRIGDELQRGVKVVHVMVHTTPAEVGTIRIETPQTHTTSESLALRWRDLLAADGFDARLHRHSGTSALSSHLGMRHPGHDYCQVRITVAQSFFLEGRPFKWEFVKRRIPDALQRACTDTFPVTDPEDSGTAPH